MTAGSAKHPLAEVFVLALLALACGGCGVVPVAPESFVQKRTREFGKALHEENWRAAARYCHKKMEWETQGRKLKGPDAIKGFLASVRDIRGRNEFYTNQHKVKKLSEEAVLSSVTYQAHIVQSSMQLKFSNLTWPATVLWVKQQTKDGRGNWLIARIRETGPRARAKTSLGGT